MKKIAVLGCMGMAGHVVTKFLEDTRSYHVVGMARTESPNQNFIRIDFFNVNKLEQIIQDNHFDVIINCVGLLNKTAEDNPDKAIWINSYFPHLLASLGKKYKFKMIHISTDCVFSGDDGSYKENSTTDGRGIYSKSKALGEIVNDKDLTLRTSIIGPELKSDGIGLFHWFMNQVGEVSGYKKVFWSGVTTLELAKGIDNAIKQDLTGLYHFVNNTKISKLDLLHEFNRFFKNEEIKINPYEIYKSDKSLISTRNDFNHKIPSYPTMISEMAKWVIENRSIYEHYIH